MAKRFIPVSVVTPPSRDGVEIVNKMDHLAWYVPRKTKHNKSHSIVSRSKMTSVETQTLYFMDPEGNYSGFVQLLYSNVMGGLYKGFQINFKVFSPKKELESQYSIWESIKLDSSVRFQDDELTVKGKTVTFQFRDPEKISKKLIKGDDDGEMDGKTNPIPFIANLKIKVNDPSNGLIMDLRCNLGEGFKISPDGCSFYLDKSTSDEDITKINNVDSFELKHRYMRHQFHPICQIFGFIKYNNSAEGKAQVLKLQHIPMVYLDAVQGILPNKAAKRWNFLYFQSKSYTILVMEYLTIAKFDSVKVTIWSICENNEIKYIGSDVNNDEIVKFNEVTKDKENGWEYPTKMTFNFTKSSNDVPSFHVENLNLVNRYDILGELPSIVKTLAKNIANIKPYLYQYCQPCHYKDEEGVSIIESTFIS